MSVAACSAAAAWRARSASGSAAGWHAARPRVMAVHRTAARSFMEFPHGWTGPLYEVIAASQARRQPAPGRESPVMSGNEAAARRRPLAWLVGVARPGTYSATGAAASPLASAITRSTEAVVIGW